MESNSKTVRLKKQEKTNGSIRVSRKYKEKNYLRQTMSSLNKISQKFETNNQMGKTIPLTMKKPIIVENARMLNYSDYYNHFTNAVNFGYDPYGHFS